MDPSTLEAVASKYQQLATVGALLGGLAFAAAISVISSSVKVGEKNKLSRAAFTTVSFAMASATCQVVSTIVWTFLSLNLDNEALMNGDLQGDLGRLGSQTFIIGVFLLFVSIGVSGWISSWRLGAVTTAIGGLGGFIAMYIIFLFVH